MHVQYCHSFQRHKLQEEIATNINGTGKDFKTKTEGYISEDVIANHCFMYEIPRISFAHISATDKK